jgi:flavodoxin
MNTLIIYDSLYGNTKRLAKAIGDAVTGDLELASIGDTNLSELASFDLVIVGSPTQGGRPTQAMQEYLGRLPSLDGVKVAAFDTRLTKKWMKVFGFAADKIADGLKARDGTLVVEPEGFAVEGKEGPLAAGELERAAAWGRSLLASSADESR